MMPLSTGKRPSGNTGVEQFWRLNARNVVNIKKSGKLLKYWTTRKAGSSEVSGEMVNSLIAFNVLENSSIVTQTDAAGVDCHA